MKSDPEPEYVSSRLSYDPETGIIVWKARAIQRPMHNQWNARWAGKPAGHLDDEGYLGIGMLGRRFRSARVAWCLAYGRWPIGVIDHINGCPGDDRLCNLREATISQNTHNQKLSRLNRCRLKGVSLHRKSGLYRARIAVDRKRRHLGYFRTKEMAAEAYRRAAALLHGEFARAT
jgi:hypothetical protein